nr:pentatricopeptide repeat-containing protein [Tanacetum cinerariifolium]
MYDTAKLYGLINLYISYFPRNITSYYFKNLTFDENHRDIQSKVTSHEKFKSHGKLALMTFNESRSWEKEQSISPLLRTPPLKKRRKGITFQGKILYADFLHAVYDDDHFDVLNNWSYEDVYSGGFFDGGSYQVSVAKQVVNHSEYANSIHLVKDKLSLHTKQNVTGIKDVEDLQEEPPKPHYEPIKTEVEEPLPLDIMYPHSHVASSVMGTNRTDEFPVGDEIFLEIDKVVFKIHTKGYFEYDPLRYVNRSVQCVSLFTHDKDVFQQCLNHIISEIDEPKWALFYCKPKLSLEKGLMLLHTDNDVHSFIDAAAKNGSINLYVAHKKQNLGKYYYKNMEWEEDDVGLRRSSSTPFSTRVKTKIIKRKKTSVIHDEGDDRKNSLVTKGRKGVVKRGKERGVVIKYGGFSNDGGKETVVTKMAI